MKVLTPWTATPRLFAEQEALMSKSKTTSSSAFDPAGLSDSRSNDNLRSLGRSGRETKFVGLSRAITGRIGCARLAPKKWTRFRIAFFFTLPLIALGLSTPAWCLAQLHAHRPEVSQDEKCTAFIETSRPGGAVSVPYGNVYRTLADARKDALNRCSQTTLAQDGWGPCRSWCVGVGH